MGYGYTTRRSCLNCHQCTKSPKVTRGGKSPKMQPKSSLSNQHYQDPCSEYPFLTPWGASGEVKTQQGLQSIPECRTGRPCLCFIPHFSMHTAQPMHSTAPLALGSAEFAPSLYIPKHSSSFEREGGEQPLNTPSMQPITGLSISVAIPRSLLDSFHLCSASCSTAEPQACCLRASSKRCIHPFLKVTFQL